MEKALRLPPVYQKVKGKLDLIFEHPVFDSAREKMKRLRQLEKPQETFETSLYTCFKCGSNVFSIAKQVRFADEGTTVFKKCRDCHNKWSD